MSLSKVTMTHAFQSTESTYGLNGMRSCACYRAQITAIFANSTSHPTSSPPSSARPHNHTPHGASRHHRESGPVVALHVRARTLSRMWTHTRTRTATRTARRAPLTTACVNLHACCPARALAPAGPHAPSPRTHTSTYTRTHTHTHRHTHMSTHA